MKNNKLETYLANFPDNATCWSQATDEIRDLCYQTRLMYNECVLDVCESDAGYVEGLNFRSFTKPSQWNTQGKKFINKYFYKLPKYAQDHVLDYVR